MAKLVQDSSLASKERDVYPNKDFGDALEKAMILAFSGFITIVCIGLFLIASILYPEILQAEIIFGFVFATYIGSFHLIKWILGRKT